MQLDEALGHISEIRAQIARTETFRGFRSLTVGFSGVLGIAAAIFQSIRIPQPAERIWNFIDLWVGVALISLVVVALELAYRWTVTDSPLKRRMTLLAVGQFAPCLVAGGLITVVIPYSVLELSWMLPGLWAIVFSLGIFASFRLFPRAIFWVGAYYLASGTAVLAMSSGPLAYSPWLMVVTFGVGQLLAAAILYFCLERGACDDA